MMIEAADVRKLLEELEDHHAVSVVVVSTQRLRALAEAWLRVWAEAELNYNHGSLSRRRIRRALLGGPE